MVEVFTVAASGAESDGGMSGVGPGSPGFWIVIGLIAALFVLYRSMRKQIRRVDFDPDATTDEERIASHHEPAAPARQPKNAEESSLPEKHDPRS